MVTENFVNDKAESAVLAAFIQDRDLSAKALTITEADFTTQERRCLFNAVRTIAAAKGDSTDLVVLSDTLRKMYGNKENVLLNMAIVLKQEQIGARYALDKHIEILKSATNARKLYDILGDARKKLESNSDAVSVMESVRQSMRDLNTGTDDWVSIGDVMAATYNALERKSKGEEPVMPSGIPTLDRCTTGFHRGELTIIGARPSVGKSAFAMSCALNAAKAGYRVGVCSREMTDEQYGTRIFQSGTDISSYKLRTGDLSLEDWTQLAQAMGYFQGYPVSFLFKTRDVEDLRATVQRRVDGDGLDMLVVDYTQLMRTKQKFDAEYQRIGFITKTLKDMTTDFHISILALAQVGRGSAGDMPTLEELRGSGDIEQDADNVLFLHRPEKATDSWIDPRDIKLFNALQQDGRQYITIRIAKQRQGQLGIAAMIFNPDRMTYLGIDGSL